MMRAAVAVGVVLLALAGVGLAGGKAPPARQASAAKSSDPWKEIDRLVSEQKLEAAADAVAKLREQAKHAGDEAGLTKALVRETELRTALHGYETAVRFLKDQPWPKGTLSRAALQLYYARALVTYSQAYGWEIGQRERIATGEEVDLKAWTREQIFAAAVAAYDEVWKQREALGREPVARLAEVLAPNNYPAEVRGTLRDAASYLFVELLSNTQGWRPEQSNELYALDAMALWKGDPAASARAKLADPAIHPLVRIGAILDDLEAWHRGRKEDDAALEARLALTRVLFANFTDGDARDALIAALERRLDGFKTRPWWAEGQAVLAELVEARGLPGALARAHALAAAGAKAFPDSVGGRRCQAMVARIEAPEYALAGMASDGLARRSLRLTHRNLGAVHLRAYAIDLDAYVAHSKDYGLLPDSSEMKRLLATKPAAAWTVALPATPDYQQHATFVTPPVDKPGLYAIVASVRPDFAEPHNLILGVSFLASGIVLVNERSNSNEGTALTARVLDGASGQPIAGAEVLMYRYDYNAGHKVVASRKTDGRGAVTLDSGDMGHSHFLVARRGADRALDASVQSFWRQSKPTERTNALVYTDRSIYRPLQKLFFKAVVFRGRGDEARYRVVANQSVTVTLRDANGREVDKRALQTNAFGSVAGEFTLPAGRLLGGWLVQTDVGGQAMVRVEEYKRPTFEVKLQEAKQAFRLNRPANVTGEARYYFGLPVTAGSVRWRVTRDPVYPFWWGWRWGAPVVRTQTVASGTARLDGAGQFGFTFTPRAAEPAKGAGQTASGVDEAAISYRYHVDADVTDEGGETRSADRSFRLGLVSVEARLDVGVGFLREAEAAKVKVVRTDLDGTPRAGNGSWRLSDLVQPPQPLLPADQPVLPRRDSATLETPGDKLRPRWEGGASPAEMMRRWPEGVSRAAGNLVHDAKGEATIALPATGAGRLPADLRDNRRFRRPLRDRDRVHRRGGEDTAHAPRGADRRIADGERRWDGPTACDERLRRAADPDPDLAGGKAHRRAPADRGEGRRGDRAAGPGGRSRRLRRHDDRAARPPADDGERARLRAVGRSRAEGGARHFPRQAAAGDEGDVQGHRPGAALREARGGGGRAARVHVRPLAGSVRAAQPPLADEPVARPGDVRLGAEQPRRGECAVDWRAGVGPDSVGPVAGRRSIEADVRLRHRGAGKARRLRI